MTSLVATMLINFPVHRHVIQRMEKRSNPPLNTDRPNWSAEGNCRAEAIVCPVSRDVLSFLKTNRLHVP